MTWFKKKPKRIKNPRIFLGHDLDNDWNYLGKAFLGYSDSDTKKSIYMFGSKNSTRRSWSENVRFHPGMADIEAWAAGLHPIYTYIREPSEFLEKHMKDTYKVVWSDKTKWWVNEDKLVVPTNATPVVVDENPSSNVISVNFSTKTDNT